MPGINIGIDLGTSNLTAYVEGKGIIFSEATAISYDSFTDEVVAIGNEAIAMLERTPDTIVLKTPIHSGVISDFSDMTRILTYFIDKICKFKVFRPNVIISSPSSITALDKKSIIESLCSSGAGKVCLIDEPIASALGVGLSIDHPHGVMVIDIGAGTCDIAVITMGTVAYSASLKIAGDDMDEAIIQYLRRERDIIIGKPTAERIKCTVGCAGKREEEFEMTVNGKDYFSGMPKIFTVNSTEIQYALKDCINNIFSGILDVMEQTPPELYSDICNEGIIVTGGTSQLYGFGEELSKRLGIKVTCAADPLHSAAKGAGIALKNIKSLEDNGYVFRSKEYVIQI